MLMSWLPHLPVPQCYNFMSVMVISLPSSNLFSLLSLLRLLLDYNDAVSCISPSSLSFTPFPLFTWFDFLLLYALAIIDWVCYFIFHMGLLLIVCTVFGL